MKGNCYASVDRRARTRETTEIAHAVTDPGPARVTGLQYSVREPTRYRRECGLQVLLCRPGIAYWFVNRPRLHSQLLRTQPRRSRLRKLLVQSWAPGSEPRGEPPSELKRRYKKSDHF
jgi:hypothetical protein